jgi:peptidoglycan-associated lipoprotein
MTGGQATGKKRTTMRALVAAGLALVCLGAASPAFADFNSDMTLKLGASGLFNHRLMARQAIVGLRQAGAHVSLNFTLANQPMALSPFLDIYHRVQNDATSIRPQNEVATNVLGGVNFIFTGPRNDRSTLYFGVGGGVARMKTVAVVNVPLPVVGYRTRMMADALIGAELKVTPRISVFLEPHYVWAPKMLNGVSAHAGLAFRFNANKPAPEVVPAPPVYIRRSEAPAPKAPEPVKTEEVKAPAPVSSAAALATMQEMIYFAHDRSDLSDAAKTILDQKLPVFRANPGLRIVITGFASQPGTEKYNMALGLRRAEAAKAYLVSQGIDPIRIEIATRGEGQLAVEGPGKAANAANRRGQFRLMIADSFLEAPQK